MNSSATPADYRAQFDFIIESRDLLSRTHVGIRKVRQLRSGLEGLKARIEGDAEADSDLAELLEEVNLILDTIDPIEKSLYQTQNESRQDPLNFPIRLNNKLTSLMNTVDVGESRPTEGALAVKAELSEAIEAELGLLDEVFDENLPALNERIKSLGIDLVSIADE